MPDMTIIRHASPPVAMTEREALIAKLSAAKPRSHEAVILRDQLRAATHEALTKPTYSEGDA